MIVLRAAALLLAMGAAVLVGLFGFGHWAEDACVTDPRGSHVPEGSIVEQSARWWPPGVRCRWHLAGGRRLAYTVTPW